VEVTVHDTQQEAFWVLRAQSGEREAFDRLLRAIGDPLLGYVSRLVGDQAMAEDVLQDVLTLVYRKLTWLEDPRLFRPWVFRIASREAFKRLKRERRWFEQVRDQEVLDALPAAPVPEPAFDPVALARLIGTLSPASRAVLILHYYHQMTLVEIGEVLDIPVGTVKSRLAYGLECLRRVLVPPEADAPIREVPA
jgi:RNA polymerase sigma-70 factor (ECF subfamily)